MNLLDQLAYCLGGILLLLLVAILILWIWQRKSSQKPYAQPTPQPSTASPTPSPPPAPVAAPQKTNWAWLVVVGILAGVILFWLLVPALKSTTPSPQAITPKRELQKHIVTRPLECLGGKSTIPGPSWIGIKKGGYATYRFTNLPVRKDGIYKIIFWATRKTTGRDILDINAGHWGKFFYERHFASDHPLKIVFFNDGVPGKAEYFLPGENFVQLSADDDLLVQMDRQPYVELTYWE